MPSGSSVPHVRRRAETSRPAFDENEKTKGFLSNNVENETRVFVKTHFHHKNLCFTRFCFTSDFFFRSSEALSTMFWCVENCVRDGRMAHREKSLFSHFEMFRKMAGLFLWQLSWQFPRNILQLRGMPEDEMGILDICAEFAGWSKQDRFVVSSWMTLTWTQFTRKHSGHASHDFGFLGLPLSTFETRSYLQCQVQFSIIRQNIPQIWIDKKSGFLSVSCSTSGDRLSCTSGAPAQNCHGTSSWPNGKGSTAHVAWQCVSIYVALLILLEGLKGGYHQFLDSLFLFIPCLKDGSRNQNYIEHWLLLLGQLPKPWAFGRMGTNFLVSTEFYGKWIWGLRLFSHFL